MNRKRLSILFLAAAVLFFSVRFAMNKVHAYNEDIYRIRQAGTPPRLPEAAHARAAYYFAARDDVRLNTVLPDGTRTLVSGKFYDCLKILERGITEELDGFTGESWNDKELSDNVAAFLADNSSALDMISNSSSVTGNGMWMWRNSEDAERFVVLGNLLRCAVFDAVARGDGEKAGKTSRALIQLGKDSLRGDIFQINTSGHLFRMGCQGMAWTIARVQFSAEEAAVWDAALVSLRLSSQKSTTSPLPEQAWKDLDDRRKLVYHGGASSAGRLWMALGLPRMGLYYYGDAFMPGASGEWDIARLEHREIFGSCDWLNNHLLLLRLALASRLWQERNGRTVENLADCVSVIPSLSGDLSAAEVAVTKTDGGVKLTVVTPSQRPYEEKPVLYLTIPAAI